MKPTRKPAKKYKSADDVFPSRKPKPPVTGTGCAENFGKPAKQPAAAPEVVYVVIGKDGESWSASPERKWAVSDRNYYSQHYDDSAPFRILKYRLDTRR